jgi:uncharacterized protein (TIGR00251 family)
VKPGARKRGILGVHDGALKVTVTAAPERGEANEDVIALLAEALDLPRDAVGILSGAASRSKTIVVPLPPDTVRKRLEEKDDVHA